MIAPPEFATPDNSDMHTDEYVFENLLPYLPQIGWAVNVGANDGIFVDNTIWLERLGWRILCIEPIPRVFEELKKNREWCWQGACAEFDSEAEGFRDCGGNGASDSALSDWSSLKVRTRRLDRILEEHSFPRLDYISIDVEHTEDRVLRGFDIERWKPIVMVIENHSGPRDAPPGYVLHNRCVLDDVFVRQEVLP